MPVAAAIAMRIKIGIDTPHPIDQPVPRGTRPSDETHEDTNDIDDRTFPLHQGVPAHSEATTRDHYVPTSLLQFARIETP